jgi:virulence factor Mce-like protein
VALVVVAAGAVALWPVSNTVHVTGDFQRAVGLYPGSDVRILGVRVGTVVSVKPAGDHVRVDFEYDGKYKVPADAKAAVVAPSLVSDRYVQLLPAWTSGPVLRDGATIPLTRTAVPVELDRISQSLDDFLVALGPQGANKQGALTHLLNSTANNFAGQGAKFHTTIANLSRLTGTLDHNKTQLFGTASQVERFVRVLAKNDSTVRNFNDSLASAADLLQGERGDVVVVDPGHRPGHAHGVEDGLLGGLHHRLVERVQALVEEELHLGDHLPRAAGNHVGGGEADDDLARAVRGVAPHPPDSECHPPAEPVDLVGEERRIGRHHRDDAPVARRPPRYLAEALLEHLAQREPAHAQVVHLPEVRHHQHAERVAAV